MDQEHALIVEAATKLAGEMPGSVIEALAVSILASSDARLLATQAIPHLHYRGLACNFLDLWRGRASSLSPEAVALALRTAAHAEQVHRGRQSLELVWTGPATDGHHFRRTEQAILQVIESADRRVLVVSYAVYRIPRICEALVRAAGRGVALSVVVETPDPQAGKDAYDTLRALGPDVALRSNVYYWPHDRRPKDQSGKSGILHVKCVVADGRRLFLSSANLTEYAFTLNMELGLLVTGGDAPGQVECHFDRLIGEQVLVKVGP